MNKFEELLHLPLIEEKFFKHFEARLSELMKEESVFIYNNRQEKKLEITQDNKRFNINYSDKLEEELKNAKFDEASIIRSADTYYRRVGEIIRRERREEQTAQREEQANAREQQEKTRNYQSYERANRDYRQSTEEMLAIRRNHSRGSGETRSSHGNIRESGLQIQGVRTYLEQSKQDNDPVFLPLNEFAEKVGYDIKREKTSRNHITMEHSNGDTIVITRKPNNHYLYFNPKDDKDRGNIYNFCRNRKIDLKSLLNAENFSNHHLIEVSTNSSLSQRDINYVQSFNNFSKAKNNKILFNRHIDSKLVEAFKLREDKRTNLCFPIYILEKNEKNQDDIKQCGYVAKLATPIFKRDGEILEKPIKALNYGKKGIEILKTEELKYLKDIETIIVTESSLDSIAYAQLHNIDTSKTILCGTGGQMGDQAIKVLNHILQKGENSKVILGFDNDQSGEAFTQKMLQELHTQNIEIQKPVYKDFCDDLAMFRMIQYSPFEILNYKDEKENLKSMISKKLTDTLKILNNENTSEGVLYREEKTLQSILKIHKPSREQSKFIEFFKENAIGLERNKER